MNHAVLKWLRKQRTNISISITMDRLYLIDELVESKEFKNRSFAVMKAIDLLLKQYYPDYNEDVRTLKEAVLETEVMR